MFNIRAYNPNDHYWDIKDVGIWSSIAKSYVSADDESLVRFLEEGGVLTKLNDEEELRDVLLRAGINDVPGYVPPVVALWQAREQIRRSGLFAQVDGAMQQAGGASLAAWEYGAEVRRDANIIQQFKALLGMTDAQIDQMFVEAAKLKV